MAVKNRHIDFKKFRKERNAAPVTMDDPLVEGKTHELPSAVPAALVLSISRMRKEYGDLAAIPSEETLELGFDLFGKKRMQEWLDNGLDIEQLQYLVESCVALYFGEDDDEETQADDDEGNASSRRKTANSSTS